MQQHVPTHNRKQRLFTASEVADFEYCPLAWWHEQFEPLAQVDTEELFAHLVELEHEHGAEARAVPEYQVVEQLLVRKGAFDEGREQHQEHAEEGRGPPTHWLSRMVSVKRLPRPYSLRKDNSAPSSAASFRLR